MKLYASENELNIRQLEQMKQVGFASVKLHRPSNFGQHFDFIDVAVESLEQHDRELLEEFCISILKDIDYSNYEEKLFVDDYLEPRIKNLLKERGVE